MSRFFDKLFGGPNPDPEPQRRGPDDRARRLSVEPVQPNPEARGDRMDIVRQIYDNVPTPRVLNAKSGKLGYFVHKGAGRDYQEDRAAIDTPTDSFISVDGMGGMGQGDKAAQILAEEALAGFRDGKTLEQIQISSSRRMGREGIGQGGACYVAGRLIDRNELEVAQAGDSRLYVINGEGDILFQTIDEEGVDSRGRHGVTNAVQGVNPGETTLNRFPVRPGFRLLLCSDGLTKNFSSSEIAKMAAYGTVEESIVRIQESSDAAMAGQVPGKGEQDNINVLLYEIASTPEERQQSLELIKDYQANLGQWEAAMESAIAAQNSLDVEFVYREAYLAKNELEHSIAGDWRQVGQLREAYYQASHKMHESLFEKREAYKKLGRSIMWDEAGTDKALSFLEKKLAVKEKFLRERNPDGFDRANVVAPFPYGDSGYVLTEAQRRQYENILSKERELDDECAILPVNYFVTRDPNDLRLRVRIASVNLQNKAFRDVLVYNRDDQLQPPRKGSLSVKTLVRLNRGDEIFQGFEQVTPPQAQEADTVRTILASQEEGSRDSVLADDGGGALSVADNFPEPPSFAEIPDDRKESYWLNNVRLNKNSFDNYIAKVKTEANKEFWVGLAQGQFGLIRSEYEQLPANAKEKQREYFERLAEQLETTLRGIKTEVGLPPGPITVEFPQNIIVEAPEKSLDLSALTPEQFDILETHPAVIAYKAGSRDNWIEQNVDPEDSLTPEQLAEGFERWYWEANRKEEITLLIEGGDLPDAKDFLDKHSSKS